MPRGTNERQPVTSQVIPEAAVEAAVMPDMSVKKRGWNCDEVGCTATVNDGPLYRANPKGRKGIFMCKDHEAQTWAEL